MRFWHKILLSVLPLFIITLDVSVIMVMKKSWQLNMDSETQRASSEQLLIANNIYENLNSIQARGNPLTPILLASVSESYGDYYRKQGIYLQLWENDRMIYPLQKGEFEKSDLKNIGQPESSDERSIRLYTELPAPYQHLLLVYQRDISELFTKQQELNRFFVMINWIAGPILLLLLYVLIQKLSKPLKLLSETSKTIAGRSGAFTRIRWRRPGIVIMPANCRSASGQVNFEL